MQMKQILNATTKKVPFEESILTRKFKPGAIAGIAGIVGGATMINEGVKGHNTSKLGKVTYANGPARMTSSFTTGSVEAMKKVSHGNYEIFSELANDTVKTRNIQGLETYGANPALISSLYNMGG